MHDAPQRCLSRPTPAKTPDSLVALAWNWFTLWMGIDLLLTLRPLNLRGWDDRAVTPCRPKDSKNRLFVISHKSKDERTKDLSSKARWLLIISVVLFAVAAGLLAWGGAKGSGTTAAAAVTRLA